MTLQQVKKSEEFVSFFTAAFDYCSLIENSNNYPEEKFLGYMRKHLLRIYFFALEIPEIEITSSETEEVNVDVKLQLVQLSNLLTENLYWKADEPLNLENDSVVCGSIVDDLIDIYRDLKSSINLFKLEDDKSQIDAIWQFKFDFQTHWETHCINAVNAIHYKLQ